MVNDRQKGTQLVVLPLYLPISALVSLGTWTSIGNKIMVIGLSRDGGYPMYGQFNGNMMIYHGGTGGFPNMFWPIHYVYMYIYIKVEGTKWNQSGTKVEPSGTRHQNMWRDVVKNEARSVMGIYPLVICYIAIENGPVEIVHLPSYKMVIFHSLVSAIKSH